MGGSSHLRRLQRLRDSFLRFRKRSCAPVAWVALASGARDLILADLQRWKRFDTSVLGPDDSGDLQEISAYLAAAEAFRTLLYYRLAHDETAWVRSVLPLLRRVWKPHPTLRFFPDDLGPGCFILHGYATGVAARSIGANFIVGQHVVIGHKAVGQRPTIGDNVTVYVGAIVIGDITIGDGAVIGAGAVVVHDVPPGVTVVGEAARPIGERRAPERP
jgi:serine O-acetyltransferase